MSAAAPAWRSSPPTWTSNNVDVDGDDLQFAWNAMAGVFVPVFRHLELDVRYRTITADDPEVDADFFASATAR